MIIYMLFCKGNDNQSTSLLAKFEILFYSKFLRPTGTLPFKTLRLLFAILLCRNSLLPLARLHPEICKSTTRGVREKERKGREIPVYRRPQVPVTEGRHTLVASRKVEGCVLFASRRRHTAWNASPRC